MFNLGFTMEELMFPENYQSDYLIDKLNDISSIENYQEQIVLEEEDDDDWFTIKQLNPDIALNENLNDQILPLNNVLSHNPHLSQGKSMVELDGTNTTLISPNISMKLSRDKTNTLSSSNTISTNSSSLLDDQQLLKTKTIIPQQQSTKYLMSKSTSSLSFCTQSSTSMTSSSADDMSLNSNDLHELTLNHHHHQHHKRSSSYSNDSLFNESNRRRRKRTIFSSADVEYLKEAFIQNPKPTQQDIVVLSEQLGHDSYVIRVWFYNKRQATKKRN